MMHAIKHIRPMRGGSQAHMLADENGRYWVVKFLNNPQHPRVLANEWIASSLARAVGLTVPDFDIMDVPANMIESSGELIFRHGGKPVKPTPGPAFASRLPTDDPVIPVYDYLPEPALETIVNLAEFAGVLAVDKWLCQCDGRQVVFCKPAPRARTRAYFIDWGFVFNAGDWNFPDSPLRGVYSRNAAYATITGWDAFEPWLSRIERFPKSTLDGIMAAVPREWATPEELADLENAILNRRHKVRDLIESVRLSPRAPFENWRCAPLAPAAIAAPDVPQYLEAAKVGRGPPSTGRLTRSQRSSVVAAHRVPLLESRYQRVDYR